MAQPAPVARTPPLLPVKDRPVDPRVHHKPLTMHEVHCCSGGCVSRSCRGMPLAAVCRLAPTPAEAREAGSTLNPQLPTIFDRGFHQLPKRSRNFSNVRTLNLV